jgi:hypothetical protein
MFAQFTGNGVSAVNRRDAPSERQHVAPVAVTVKQCVEENLVPFGERVFELAKPICRSRRYVVGLDQNWQPPGRRR